MQLFVPSSAHLISPAKVGRSLPVVARAGASQEGRVFPGGKKGSCVQVLDLVENIVILGNCRGDVDGG